MNMSISFKSILNASRFFLGLLAFAPASDLLAQQIEAEAWTTMFGLQTEATSDAGAGLNVGWIDANDWAEYLNKPLAAGNWKVEARMATMATGRSIQVYVDDVLKTTVTYAGNTAGWQTWTTVTSAQFNIATGGNHKIRLVFPGNNMNLNWIRFVAQVDDVTPPTVPTGLNSPSKTNTTVNLAWSASTDAVGVTGYDIYRDGVLLASVGNVLEYQATGLTANTSYSFQVRAKDAAGNLSALGTALSVATTNVSNLLVNGDFANGNNNWALFGGQQLTVPGEYAVNVAAAGNVWDVNLVQVLPMTQGLTYTLTFRARSNVNRTMVAGWGLAQAPWTNQNQMYNLTDAWTSHVLTGASTVPSNASSRVFFDLGGMTGEVHIDDVVMTTGTADTQLPTVPAGLASPSQTTTTINLTWTASTDNVAVTGYDVYRGGVLLASVGNVTAYQATALTANTAYSFQVRAKDGSGNVSALSAALNVSTTNVQGNNLLVNGDFANGYANWAAFGGAQLNVPGEYAVNVAAAGNVWDVNLVQVLPMTQGLTYTLTFRARSNVNRTMVAGWGLAQAPWTNQNQMYNLTNAWADYVFTGVSTVPSDVSSRVFFDVGGMTGEVHIDNVVFTTGTFADTQAPTVPAGVASPSQGETSINLAWTASTDNVGVTGYEIHVNGVLNSTVGAVANAQITGLVKATTYSIRVLAADAAGNKSALSTAINVTTANDPAALMIEAENWTTQNGLLTEATTDIGGGLNVGWIDPLDWAEYANQPLAAGTYRLEARVATTDVNRSIQLSIDGAMVTTLTQPIATGGWQTWTTAVSADFTIATGGNHLIRLGFPMNAMNLNWIRLVPSAPDVQAPTVPANLASPSQTGTSANLTWTPSSDNIAVTGYELFVNGTLKTTVGAVNAATITGLALQTQYAVQIRAVDGVGNKSALSASIPVTTTNVTNLNGIYVLRNRNSLKCVDITAGDAANGAIAIQTDCIGTRSQKWELTLSAGTNVYKLKNVNSGKLLDVQNAGATNNVQQWEDGNGAAQQWRIQAATTGHYTLNATSDMTECLDVFGISKASGATMHTYGCNALSSQEFALVPTEATTACVAGAAPTTAIATQEIWAGIPFVQPMELVQEPAAAGNSYIVMDKTGMVRRVLESPTDNVNRTFFNMDGRLTLSGEAGLASFAFDPDYGNGNRFVYLTYISNNPMELRLSRLTANATGTAVDLATEVVLFRFARTSDIHHSGALAFGPGPVAGAKYLYMSVGDNGNNANGDLTPVKVTQGNWPHGKILRLSQAEYRSATQLPWNYNNGATNAYIVATGLRNPWRLSFDGDDMWISNVGFAWNEEINKFNVKTEIGVNFGWPWCEGNMCCEGGINCNLAGLPPMPGNLTAPFYTYPRSDGTTGEGAVIGGFVYRGAALPGLVGKYVFTDFVDQQVFALDPVTKVRTQILANMGNVADIGQDRNGEILLTDYGRSNIYKIIPGAGTPVLAWPPQNLADAGCFESLNNGDPIPKPGVNRFNVAQKFWSDGADKERMVSLPPGATMDVSNPDDWTLPIGGVTIKNFFWQGDIFETRLFVRHTNETYAGYTYKWNSPTSAALVATDGDTKDLGGGMLWKYPSRAQCMTCHNEKTNGSLALETRQINVGTQLADMAHQGLFNSPNPTPLAPFPDHLDWTVPIGERANAYMHVNCSNCHRGPTESAAGRATWDARYTTPLANKRACDEMPVEPVSGNVAERIIKPGDHTLSTVWLRAHQRTNQYMPPLGSSVPDVEGVNMLKDWMNLLTGCQ